MKPSLKVLVVEDSPMAAEAILRALRDFGYELAAPQVVDNPENFAAALTNQNWDVVISDYVMPFFNGTEALEIFQRHKTDIPFICVSGEIGEEKAAEVIHAGAHNYVSKSHLARLGQVVRLEIAAAEARRERRQAVQIAAHLAAIVEGSDDAILSKDLNGKILTWNPAATAIYGYSAEEVVGRNISLLVPPEKSSELVDVFARLQRGERVERLETTRVRKNGTIIAVALTISPIRDEHGLVVGVSSIARDITERLQLEQERSKLIADLQHALARVKQLSGLLPICANCKRIRDEHGEWQPVEVYVHAHSQADFTHGICPDCTQQLYPDIFQKMQKT